MIRDLKLNGVRIQGFRSIGGDVRNGHFGNRTLRIVDPVIDPLDVRVQWRACLKKSGRRSRLIIRMIWMRTMEEPSSSTSS